jgi:ribosomal protein S12 methylthiotransferase accessory factor YcaO
MRLDSERYSVNLTSRRKYAPAFSERTIPPAETIALIADAAAAVGVTRLADITGLDRIGIPVYSAMVPASDEGITVSSGKGVHPIDARTGALMEAIERQTALRADLPIINGSFGELRQGEIAVTDPLSISEELRGSYNENHSYCWTPAYDLNTGNSVLVPAGVAGYGPKYWGNGSPFRTQSSNGLASGNCLEEAVCHALCELIERDSATLAELRSHWVPRARREALFGAEAGAGGADDPNACPRIDLSRAKDPIPELMEKFRRAGLDPVVRDMTSDLGVCSIVASVADDDVPGLSQAHGGQGAHLNSTVAVVRALLELAQSRAVDIQGVREDILPASAIASPRGRDMQRVAHPNRRRWVLQQSGIVRPFQALASVENEDMIDDIHLLLSNLARAGLQQVLVIPFAAPAGLAVVRVIVPGLEFWSVHRRRIGQRALEFWKRHAA